ncbi:MAG: hypothetical protein RL071_3291 [Pseudomonadota bacterium]
MPRTLLVTGASGQLGRHVVELLLARGQDRVIAATRDPSKLADLAARGVEVRALDLDQDDQAAAFAGVDRALLISTDALDRPGRRLEQHLRGIAAAKAAGVGHLVYTSLVEAGSQINLLAPDHAQTEAALVASGLQHTILRNNLYAENLLGSLPGAVAGGVLYSAAGDGKVAYVSRSDCARAAAAVLAGDTGGAQRIDISGARAWSVDEIAALAARISGRPVRVQQVPVAGLAAGMEAHGLPAPVAAIFASFDAATAAGEYGAASGVIEALTGAPAEGLEVVLGRAAAALGGTA